MNKRVKEQSTRSHGLGKLLYSTSFLLLYPILIEQMGRTLLYTDIYVSFLEIDHILAIAF